MELKFTAKKSAAFLLKANIAKFGFVKNIFLAYTFKSAKISCLFLGGLYYNSYVTSFVQDVRSRLPHSITARIQAARNFMNLSFQNKLTYFSHKNMNTAGNTEVSERKEEVYGQELTIDKESINFTSQVQTGSIDDFIPTSDDIMEVALRDLREFGDEVVNDFVVGTASGVEKAALKYLDQTFREEDVHRAIISVINSSLREKSFIKESRDYGITLMKEVVKDKLFLQNTKKLSLEVLRQPEIKNLSKNFLKNSINHVTVQHFVKILMKEAFLQTEAKQALIDLVTEAVILAVRKPETNGHLGKLITTALSNETIIDEAKNSILFSNFKMKAPFSEKSKTGHTFELSAALEERIDTWVKERHAI